MKFEKNGRLTTIALLGARKNTDAVNMLVDLVDLNKRGFRISMMGDRDGAVVFDAMGAVNDVEWRGQYV